MHNISVIIPTMNRPKTLLSSLECLSKYIEDVDEVIVIDQSLDVDTRNEIQGYIKNNFSFNLKYIYQKKPSSSKARNIGIKNAKNDLLIFMDDDVEFDIDIIKNVKVVMKQEDIALVAGINDLSKDSKSIKGYIFGIKSIRKRKKGHVVGAMFGNYPNKSNKIVSTEWAMGYFFVVRKRLVEKYNVKFDENLTGYAYAEDLDFTYQFCKIANNEGYRCIIDPSVHVKHLHSEEHRYTTYKTTAMYIVNREYLSYKHCKGIKYRILTRWANIGEFLRRFLARDNAFDVIKAQFYCDLNRNIIKKGKIPYEVYEK